MNLLAEIGTVAWKCPKCLRPEEPTRHHVFPLRRFPNQKEPLLAEIQICRECHDELERRITAQEKAHPDLVRDRDQYYRIVESFFHPDQHSQS